MSTASLVIDANQSGLAYTADLNSGLAAINTCHSGASAPTTQVAAGKLWLDTGGTNPVLKIYRSGWKSLFTLNATNISTSVNALTTATANVTSTSTFTGLITADGGIKANSINTTSGDITLDSAGDITLDSAGDITLDSAGEIYLKPTNDDVYMQGVTVNEQLRFNLGTNEQAISSSDALLLASNNNNPISIGSASGTIKLLDGSSERGYLDVNTTDTIKLYTGSAAGTLNSTWSGDDLTVQGDVNSVSDVRTKENIESVKNSLDLVSQLRGVWYNKIGEENRKVGVIAQEVEEVLPEVVHTDTEGMKAVDYGKMVGVLIEAIKEQQVKIEALEKRLGDK